MTTNVHANVSGRCSQRIRERCKTVAAQTDLLVPEIVQVDLPNHEPIQRRRKSISVAVQAVQNTVVWCICRNEEYGKMIYCENPLCMIQWFHMDCMNLQTVPKGNWYCANCQLINKIN